MDYSSTLGEELATRLSRQIDLIAASSVVDGAKRGSPREEEGNDDDGDEDEEDYEQVNEDDGEDDGSVPAYSTSSDTSNSADDAATASLEANPSMLALQASLARVRSNPMPASYSKLKDSIEQAWESEMELQHAQTIVSAAATSTSSSVTSRLPDSIADNLVWTVNAHLTASSYCAVLESLLNHAEKVKQEEMYWQSIESRDRYSTMYLVQSECHCSHLRLSVSAQC